MRSGSYLLCRKRSLIHQEPSLSNNVICVPKSTDDAAFLKWVLYCYLQEFSHANDFLFCKFCCRCMGSNSFNRHTSQQTTNVRHSPISEVKKMCSKESKCPLRYVYYFPSASISPLFFAKTLVLPTVVLLTISGQNYWGSQGIAMFASVYGGVKALGSCKKRPMGWSEGMLYEPQPCPVQPNLPTVSEWHTLFVRGWKCWESGGGLLVLGAGIFYIPEQFTTSILGI